MHVRLTLLLLLLPSAALADVVRLDFTGTATLTTGIFADEVVLKLN